MRATLIFATLAAIVASSPIVACASTTGGLSGTVLTDRTGLPIANATVRVMSSTQVASTHTDSHGNFTFVSLTPDVYEIAVEKEGFIPWKVLGVAIFSDSTARVSARLSYAPVSIVSVRYYENAGLVRPHTTSDVYPYGNTTLSIAPPAFANSWMLRMTPGITFGVGAPVMH